MATNWDGTAKTDKDGNVKYKNKNIYGKEERTRDGYLKEYYINLSQNNQSIWSINISSFDKRHDVVKVSKYLKRIGIKKKICLDTYPETNYDLIKEAGIDVITLDKKKIQQWAKSLIES